MGCGNWQGVCSPSRYIRSFQQSQKIPQKECLEEKDSSWFPFNKHTMNICNKHAINIFNKHTYAQWISSTNMQWISSTNIQWIFQLENGRAPWLENRRTSPCFIFSMFYQTYSMFSNPGLQDSNEGLVDILLFGENIHLVPKMKWAKRTKWIARISLQSWQRSRNNNGDWFTFSLCQKV